MFRLYVNELGFSLDPTEWNRASSVLIGGVVDVQESERAGQLLFVKQAEGGLLLLRCAESFDKREKRLVLLPPFSVKFVKTQNFAISYHPSLQSVVEIDDDDDDEEDEEDE